MSTKSKELERMTPAGGWKYKSQEGSRRYYIHPVKPEKAIIPSRGKTLLIGMEYVILKQASLR